VPAGNADPGSQTAANIRSDRPDLEEAITFRSAHPRMSDDIDQRVIDLLAPVWHVLDLTPPGRCNWYAQLEYTANGGGREQPLRKSRKTGHLG
jgi:predicted dithiol-disulfide oxidoreductase (DUF899 family)